MVTNLAPFSFINAPLAVEPEMVELTPVLGLIVNVCVASAAGLALRDAKFPTGQTPPCDQICLASKDSAVWPN